MRLRSKIEKSKEEDKGDGGDESKDSTLRETIDATTRRGIEGEEEDDEEIAKLMEENEK